jgi:hypothetical protein|nr:MAG TPA: hypothetical protein [Caudoviricetes sp.]
MKRVFNLLKRGGRKVMDKVEATKEVVSGLLNDSDKRKILGIIIMGVGLGVGAGLFASGYVG